MIPNILWQTWKNKNIPTAVKLQYNTWSVSNKQLKRNLFDDKECATFILQHFGQEIYQKYINLPQSIMRADFWRVAVVYINGGYYSDLDIEINEKLDNFIPNLNQKEAVFIKELDNIANFFFGATPKHPVLKNTLDQMIFEMDSILNKESQSFGMNPLHNSVRKYYKIQGTNYISDNTTHFLQNEKLKEDKKLIHIGASGFDKLGDYISWRHREKIMMEERQQSKEVLFFTTFNKNGYDLYGKTWVQTFIKVANYYNKFKAKIYYEGFKPKEVHPSIQWVDFKQEIPHHEQWKQEYLQRNNHADYVKTMCVRFSFKGFVIQDVLKKHNNDYLIWLDGDCIFKNEDFTKFPSDILQDKFLACQMEHAHDLNHIESGILIFNGKHKDKDIFNKHFIENYKVNNVVKMGEPYDGFIVSKSLITSKLSFVNLNEKYGKGGIQSDPNLTFLHPEINKRFHHNIGWTGKNQYKGWDFIKDRDDIYKKMETTLFGNNKIKKEKRKKIFNKLEKLKRMRAST
jgi:mannosyltransferase OCH1-like enzyme